MGNGIDALSYSAANARLRGLKAQLIEEEGWRDLLQAEDVRAALDILRETSYGDLLADYDPQTQSIEDIERFFTARGAQNHLRAMAFLQGARRDLVVVLWQRYELENLKAVFRGLDQQMDINRLKRFLTPLGTYSTLPWDSLMHERTVLGLVELLSDTHYINPLRNALPLYQRDHTLFALEVALDIRYYRDLAAAVNRLSGEDHRDARRIIGTKIDLLNIAWAYRYREYYKLSPEEIVNYTLWHTFRTDTNLVRDIAMGADPREVLERVFGNEAFDLSAIGDYFQDEARGLMHLELALERYWRRLALAEMGGYPFRLGSTLGYLILVRYEIRDIITLLESKVMGWEPERIQQHLIRDEE